MADSDSDDILSADFLEPGELLDSDDEQPNDKSTSARTDQTLSLNRPKVRCSVVNRSFKTSMDDSHCYRQSYKSLVVIR